MTLTTRLFRLFSLGRGNAGRARVPRLESLNLSSHDLADLNLPPYYRASFDSDRALMLPDQHR
ncbi:hypothetical protein [Taklimakanibacter deserti]|uniref:hypothetical protein n=1 Tax=Taklimakanibacter deserti TaxID=2267839 RepID=UPI0013C43978